VRRLVLRKEALTELRPDELAGVAGGAVTSPIGRCLEPVTSMVIECDSNLRPCISNTCAR
jgi:hypothetical protein